MKFSLFLLLGLFVSSSTIANDELEEEFNVALSRLLPDVQIDSVKPTPVDGLYQIVIGSDVLYMTRDGKYVFKGEILDIYERRNLTEDVRAGARVKLLDSIDKDDYIEFASENTQDAIYVFTDIDCGYCRNFIVMFLN